MGVLGTNQNFVTAMEHVSLAFHIWKLDSKKGVYAFCTVLWQPKFGFLKERTLELQAELVTMDDFDGLGVTKLEIPVLPSGERWK